MGAGRKVRVARAAKAAVGAAAALCLLAGASACHRQLGAALHRLLHIRPGWLLVGIAAQAGSIVAFSAAQRILLRAARVDVGLATLSGMTLAGNAIATTMPGGAAWSGAWFFGQLRRRGADRSVAGWALVVSGALASVVLFMMLTVGALIAGSHGAASHVRAVLVALALIPVAALVVRPRRRSRPGRAVATGAGTRAEQLVARAVDTVFRVRPSKGDWRRAAGLMAANWAMDAVCLAAAAAAVGGGLPWRAVLVVFCATQVAASLPVTPGGLGVVEAGMSVLLMSYGLDADRALAVTAAYRLVSFWLLNPAGWAAFGVLQLRARRSGAPLEVATPQPAVRAAPARRRAAAPALAA